MTIGRRIGQFIDKIIYREGFPIFIICSRCKQYKHISEFHNKKRKFGKSSTCKKCVSEYDKERLAKNPEYFKAKNDRNRMKRVIVNSGII